MKNLFSLVLISLLFGCGQQKKQNTSNDNPKPIVYNTPAGDKIIFLEDYYRFYLQAIKTNYANRNRIYEGRIQDSIFHKYFLTSEYSEQVKNKLSSPIRDTAGLRNYIAGIAKNHAKMEELITVALAESNKYLKNDSITIYIFPSNADIEMTIEGMGGVTSFTAGSKQIILVIDTSIILWKEMLPCVIARELNHAYWTKMNFNKSYQPTLLDCLVYEGKADWYSHSIYPNEKHPWANLLSEKVQMEIWDRIKSQLKNKDIAFQYSIMLGSKSEYPSWGGYALGYTMVQAALKKHTELIPAEWTNISSEKILEMSNYK